MAEDTSFRRAIPAQKLRRGMHEVFIFLEAQYQDELVRQLDIRGINLLGSSSYTLAEVELALKEIFGEHGTSLIMERLREVLKSR
jgi:hypothetical protein